MRGKVYGGVAADGRQGQAALQRRDGHVVNCVSEGAFDYREVRVGSRLDSSRETPWAKLEG